MTEQTAPEKEASKEEASEEEQKGKEDSQEEDGQEDEEEVSSGLDLSEQEEAQVEELARPNALVVHEVIREEGERELTRPVSGLAWSALSAGLSMGFSLVAEGLLMSYLPKARWQPLVANLGYTVGFLIVITGRQQLFTETTLTPVLPLLNRPQLKVLGRLLRLWLVVLVANLVGAYLFSFTIGHTGVFDPHVRQVFDEIGRKALEGGFALHLLRGIFAGWLIALVVWLLPSAENGRIPVIIILTYLVGLAGLSHVIAGSVEVLYLVTTGGASWNDYLLQFLLPTLVGNTLGGVTLVAALNYGQVAPNKS